MLLTVSSGTRERPRLTSITVEEELTVVTDVLDPAKHGYPQDQTVLTLVKSIHRWISSGDGEQPSDFAERNREKNSKGTLSPLYLGSTFTRVMDTDKLAGLKYLAMTLTALPKEFLQSTHSKNAPPYVFC